MSAPYVRTGDRYDDRHREIIAIAEGLGFTGHSDDLGLTFRDAGRFVVAAAEREDFEPLHGYGPGRYEAWLLDCAAAAAAYLDEQNRDPERCPTCGALDPCDCRIYLVER